MWRSHAVFAASATPGQEAAHTPWRTCQQLYLDSASALCGAYHNRIVCRLEFLSILQLEAESMQSCVVGVNRVTKMKPNMADVPYTVERNKQSTWVFTLTYAKLESFMPLAQEQLVMSRLPAADR